jgi:hypothetical protein
MSLLIGPKKPSPAQFKDWEPHKDRICHLYCTLNKSLKEVAEIMQVEHNFYATYVICYDVQFSTLYSDQEIALNARKVLFWACEMLTYKTGLKCTNIGSSNGA